MKCIDQTGESIKQHLELATNPADQAEVERVLDSFQTQIFSTRSSSPGHDNSDCDDESLSSVNDKEEEIDFDDNEILDQDFGARHFHSRGDGRASIRYDTTKYIGIDARTWTL